MKILYQAFHHDPHRRDAGSGADFFFWNALTAAGHEVIVDGPFAAPPMLPERAFSWLYRRFTQRKYCKFDLSSAWRCSQRLATANAKCQPDCIFSIFFPGFVVRQLDKPSFYRVDTTFIGAKEGGDASVNAIGPSAFRLCVWQERRAFQHVRHIITSSAWSRDILVSRYGVAPEKVCILISPITLPEQLIPTPDEAILLRTHITFPLQLLLVGREYYRKGVDIAIEIVQTLMARGVPAQLTVCGVPAPNHCPANVRFVGPFRKSNPDEVQQYVQLYRDAHLLLHPARFEAAGMVPSEATAFGVPTITNNVGGLGTTVEDDVSGLVLPGGSLADAYVDAIMQLVRNPDRYFQLRVSTRKRFEQEKSPQVTAKRFINILETYR